MLYKLYADHDFGRCEEAAVHENDFIDGSCMLITFEHF